MKLKTGIWLPAAAALLCVVAAGVWSYNRWFSERANPSLSEYPVRGVDLSAHNGDVDFNLLKENGISFAYIKATEGTDFMDRNFIRNAAGVQAAGIPAGAYHFFRFDTDGEMQAWNFMNALKGRRFLLPPAVDIEEWGNPDHISTQRIIRQLRAMLTLLREEGYSPMLYTNKDGYNRFVKGYLDDYPLWICSFTDPPLPSSNHWAMWQFSHRGRLPGVSGDVDLNTLPPGSTLPGQQ